MFGVSERDAKGGPLEAYLDAFHPDDLATVHANIADSLATGKPYQYQFRLRHRDGAIRHIHGRGKIDVDANGKPAWTPGVVLDITQQKLAEEARLRTGFQFRTIIDSNVLRPRHQRIQESPGGPQGKRNPVPHIGGKHAATGLDGQ